MVVDVKSRADARLGAVLAVWVDFVRPRARAVVVLCCLTSAALAVYTAFNLGVDTDVTRIVSAELPFFQKYDALAQTFPILDEALIVVVDAATPYEAAVAADALAERLEARPDRFERVFVQGGGEFFRRNALLFLSIEQIENLSDHVAEAQPLLAELARDGSLDGLVRALDTVAEQSSDKLLDAFDWPHVLDQIGAAFDAARTDQPAPTWWHDLLYGSLLPEASSRRVIVTEPVLEYESMLPGREAVELVRSTAVELGLDEAHGVRVRLTGNVGLNHEEMGIIIRQATVALSVSLLLVAVILTVGLSSRRIILAIIGTLLTGLIWTAAFAAATVGELNILSVAFGVLFVGLGVDFGIHFGMRYAEVVRAGATREEALRETAESVGASLAICACTTAVGFYAFLPTSFRAVAELGLISGTGMFISLFLNLTLLPALLSLGEAPVAPDARRWLDRVDTALTGFCRRQGRSIRVAALLAGLGSLALLPRASFDHDVVSLRDPGSESAIAFDELLSEHDSPPWNMDVVAPDLEAARADVKRLSELEVVERAITVADFVPEDQEEKRELLADVALFLPSHPQFEPAQPRPTAADRIAGLAQLRDALRGNWAREAEPALADSAAQLAEALDRFIARAESDGDASALLGRLEALLVGTLPEQLREFWEALEPDDVELADLPASLTEQLLAADGRTRIQVFARENLRDPAAMARFVDAVEAAYPEATGIALALLETARTVVRSLQQALFWSVLAIALLLFVLWRSFGDTLLVLTPLALAAALTGASTVVLSAPFNFGNVVVVPLLLGIGVDSGIHLLHRHRISRTTGADVLKTSSARAILFSGLTTIASFGTLTFASHGGLSSLGRFLTLGIVFTLVCNLIVLPALLTRNVSARGAAG